jgi:hypothetical protein
VYALASWLRNGRQDIIAARFHDQRNDLRGDHMTILLPESSFSQDAPINSMKHNAAAVSLGRISNLAAEALHDDSERQVQSLCQLICELLVKNQQLRWALMETKEHELRDKEGPAKDK